MSNLDKAKRKADELIEAGKKDSFDKLWEFVRWHEISHKEEYELADYYRKRGKIKSLRS